MKATSDFLPNLKALSVKSLLSVLLLLGLVMAQVPTAKEETRTKLTLHLISTLPDYSGPSHFNARPALLAFNKEGSLVAMSAEGKTVRLFDTANGKLKYTLRGDKWGLNGFGFSPNGQTLATRATLDHSVTLWDSLTGQQKIVLAGRKKNLETKLKSQLAVLEQFLPVLLSPDGLTVLTEREDDVVVLWDTSTGKEKATLDHETQSSTAKAILSAPFGPIIALDRHWTACPQIGNNNRF